ncbi:MAG: C39 family peptidase [Patescibacteria group bacterium]|jgi:predicted  nucleic acid-binding Zn-ribbon protein
MKKYSKGIGFFVRLLIIMTVLSQIVIPYVAMAESQSVLRQQRSQYLQAAEEARRQAAEKESQARAIEYDMAIINSRIFQTEKAIATTDQKINRVRNNIDDIGAKVRVEEDNLAQEKVKMARVVSSWYMEGDDGLLRTLMGSENISDAVDTQEQYGSVKRQIEEIQAKISQVKESLIRQRNEQESQREIFESLRNDQESARKNLENDRALKDRLLSDTHNTIADLRHQEQEARDKMSEIDNRISSLVVTRSWGDQIVSSNDPSWYYSQAGNFARLGNSPYTINQYGCLITSIAMVAKYYGNGTTPNTIASNGAIFSGSGALMVSSPPGIGINVTSNQSIDWSVVDREIATGQPVIVSIYLPDVGAINNDGSSHFIVIKDKVGGKYIMHDPLGDGRGYATGQVRSMRLARPY